MAAVAAAAAAVADAAAATATAVANAAVRLWLIQSNWFLHFRCVLVPFRLFLKLLLLFMIDVSLSLRIGPKWVLPLPPSSPIAELVM